VVQITTSSRTHKLGVTSITIGPQHVMDFGGPRDGVHQEENFDDLIDFDGGDGRSEGNQGEDNADFEFDIDGFNRVMDPTSQQTNGCSFNPVFNVSGANANNHFEIHPQYHAAPGPASNQAGNHGRVEQGSAAQNNKPANIGGHQPHSIATSPAVRQGMAGRSEVYTPIKRAKGRGTNVPEHETKKVKKDRKTAQ